MTNEELAVHATKLIQLLHEGGVGVDDALSVIASALATVAVNNVVTKEEFMENVAHAYDMVAAGRSSN